MKNIICFILPLAFFISCNSNSKPKIGLRKTNGDAYYGGVFRMNEIDNFRNLYPLHITGIISHHIASQIYEGLVKLNQADLSVRAALAESWTKNDDATQWTFHIRKGATFHDDECFEEGKGREVKATDFKYCFEKLCTASPMNELFNTTFKDRVSGANEFYESTQKNKPLPEGVSGVKVMDDYTIQINLVHPFAGFLNILSTTGGWVYPHEALEKYSEGMSEHCVGTGPFKSKHIKKGETIELERNPVYWAIDDDRNQLPYLDGVEVTFIKDKYKALQEFKNGKLDMVFRLPNDMVPKILTEFENAGANPSFYLQIVPAMSIYYLGFNCQSSIFSKKEVRLAFNYAIDRKKIVDFTMEGDGIPAFYGIVPPGFKNYDSKTLNGYSFDSVKAQKFLADAGYPNGKAFPKIILLVDKDGGTRNIQVATEIQSMLKKNLNVDIDINIKSFTESLELIESGQADFFRTGWNADYPDPENFLSLLYSKNIPANSSDKSYLNSERYKNESFDKFYTQAMQEVDEKTRMNLYHQADQTALDDGAIMPVFYDENYRLIQIKVKNFPANAMEYRDLSTVYFQPIHENKKAKEN